MARAPGPDVPTGDPRTTGEVVQDVIRETQTLFRQEVELAKLELQEAAAARAQAVGALVVAGVLALFAVGFLLAGVAAALDDAVAPWLARLIVAVSLLVIAGLAALFAKGRAGVEPATRITESLKEDARWARTQLHR